jgi:hypothetical protein
MSFGNPKTKTPKYNKPHFPIVCIVNNNNACDFILLFRKLSFVYTSVGWALETGINKPSLDGYHWGS